MSEVSAWNAVDASNSATPPDGWPEGMQPAAVNDAGRMMMGALRREHDRIVAQVGVTAGAISTTTISATTISATTVNATSFVGGTVSASSLYSSGNATVSGTLAAFQLTSSGNASVVGALSTGSLSVNADSTFYGNITGFGNVQVNGTLTAGALSTSGAVTATGLGSNVAGLVVNSGSGTEALAVVGGDIGIHNGHTILPNVPNTCAVGILGFAFSVMNAYGYVTASDRRAKADIKTVEPGSIEIVQRIAPRTYRIPGGGDPQARHWGFIAQEVGEAMRAAGREFGGHVIGDDENRSEGLNYNELIAVLWGAVRELTARLETLEAGGS